MSPAGPSATDPVAVIGLGKLGLSLAASLALGGCAVVGVDLEPRVVAAVNAGRAPHAEPGLDAALAATAGRTLSATTEIAAAAAGAASFILVQSPSLPDGSFSTAALEAALAALCHALAAAGTRQHVIIIGTTVNPGTIAGRLAPLAEAVLGTKLGTGAGAKAGEGIALCYNPELVALGATLQGFQNPDLVIIGADDPAAGDVVEGLQRRLLRNAPPIHRMSIASAEITKLALNGYLTLKISYANLLSQLCARIPGAELDRVTSALGADRRIGAAFLRSGNSFGGPCFPRDTKALSRFARDHGGDAGLMAAVDRINTAQAELLAATVLREVAEAGAARVGLLGLAYKEKTPVMTGSAASHLVPALRAAGLAVTGWDPLAGDAAHTAFGEDLALAASAAACIESAPVLVLINREPEAIAALAGYAGTAPRRVVDCWRALDPAALPPTLRLVPLGYCVSGDTNPSPLRGEGGARCEATGG